MNKKIKDFFNFSKGVDVNEAAEDEDEEAFDREESDSGEGGFDIDLEDSVEEPDPDFERASMKIDFEPLNAIIEDGLSDEKFDRYLATWSELSDILRKISSGSLLTKKDFEGIKSSSDFNYLYKSLLLEIGKYKNLANYVLLKIREAVNNEMEELKEVKAKTEASIKFYRNLLI